MRSSASHRVSSAVASRRLRERDVLQATIDGSVLRLRPKLMTVTMVMASLVPIMWSTGVGSDVMKPIAGPIIGEMITTTSHVLIIAPDLLHHEDAWPAQGTLEGVGYGSSQGLTPERTSGVRLFVTGANEMKQRTLAQSCCTTPSAMFFWAAMFALFYGASLLLGMVWPELGQYGDTLILVSLAAACFVNFGRNRTLHCGLTGPLFVVGAVVALLMESGMWNIDHSVLWGVVLVGVAVAFLIEWRTIRRERAPNA